MLRLFLAVALEGVVSVTEDQIDTDQNRFGIFANAGLAVASLVFAAQHAFGYRDALQNAVVHPALTYFIAFIISVFAISRKPVGSLRLDILRDALPVLAFCGAAFAAGVRQD